VSQQTPPMSQVSSQRSTSQVSQQTPAHVPGRSTLPCQVLQPSLHVQVVAANASMSPRYLQHTPPMSQVSQPTPPMSQVLQPTPPCPSVRANAPSQVSQPTPAMSRMSQQRPPMSTDPLHSGDARLPSGGLAQGARKTNCFFSRHPYSYEYQLKSPEQYLAESGVSNPRCDSRCRAADPDTDLERADRVQFQRPSRRCSVWEGKLRICPDEAIAHPFITMPHLQRWPQSQLCMESETLMQVCYRQPATCLQPAPPAAATAATYAGRRGSCGCFPLPTLLACLAPSIIHPLPLLCRRRRRRLRLRRLRHRPMGPRFRPPQPAAAAARSSSRARSRIRCHSTCRCSQSRTAWPPLRKPPRFSEPPPCTRPATFAAVPLAAANNLLTSHGAASTALAVSSRQHRHPVQVAVCHPFNVKEDPYAAAAAAAAAAGLCPASSAQSPVMKLLSDLCCRSEFFIFVFDKK
uniref:ETS domain-containing protein n=1 Tax=Macrostomum lignano TaxID=282301 RepID=A0A1I8F6B6_9PLAT